VEIILGIQMVINMIQLSSDC